MDLHWAFALIATAAFIIGGVVGFFLGVDAGDGILAERWLQKHPDEGDLRIRDTTDDT